LCAQGVARPELPAGVQRTRAAEIERALRDGWSALPPADQSALLGDPLALSRLHMAVWSDAPVAESWRLARDAARALPPTSWQPAPPVREAARPAA
jgi:membrane glycosyltransferase